jgi:hypothetical protein
MDDSVARRSVNCGYGPLYECSCLTGGLHFLALLTGEMLTPAGTRAGVYRMKQQEAQRFVVAGARA